MAPTETSDLPMATIDVLARRAGAAGISLPEQVRRELIARAAQRVPLDSVVEFLHAERPAQLLPAFSADAATALEAYQLPTQTAAVLLKRAAAAGLPAAEYVRAELIALARRRTVEDELLEISAALDHRDPAFASDMAAIAAAVCDVRGIS